MTSSCVLNGTSASAGDVFCIMASKEEKIMDVIQAKKTKKSLTLEMIKEERRKAADDRDLFTIITTGMI